jgi:hypothetical protein
MKNMETVEANLSESMLLIMERGSRQSTTTPSWSTHGATAS